MIGIDTVTLGFQIDTFPRGLDGWYYLTGHKDSRTWERCYRWILMPSRSKLKVTFYAQNITASEDDPSLSLEFSFPKVLYENNLQTTNDLEKSLEIVSRELRLIPQIPPLNLYEGNIQRIDICNNHQVDDLVPYYINAISRLNYPQHDTIHYLNKEVLFKADCGSSKFYDKQSECKLSQAYGILRHEVTLRDRGRIEELTGLHNPTIQSFTPDCNKKILTYDLQRIYLDKNIIANHEFANEILIKRYGQKEGEHLMNLLLDRQILSKKQVREKYGYSDPSTINKAEKKITNAGITMALTNRNLPLPPLGIDL